MDMTYFGFTTESLKKHKLKIGIVFLHKKVSFEIWLSGVNNQIQKKYWEIFKAENWEYCIIHSDLKGRDSIIEKHLSKSPDFNDTDSLMLDIESEALSFIREIDTLLKGRAE